MRTWLKRLYASWEEFWFRPADPIRLGLLRIGTGVIVVYTIFAYSFRLQEFMGPHAWLDLETRMWWVRHFPVQDKYWWGFDWELMPRPSNPQQELYVREYYQIFNDLPPPPYPRNDEEIAYCNKFRMDYKIDLRKFGLPPPTTTAQREFLETFTKKFGMPPAPPYPRDDADAEEIIDRTEKNRADWGNPIDPHRLLAEGTPAWSIWFHVTNERQMWLVHGAALTAACLFLVGLWTRVTAPLTWFFFLNYVHRSPNILFGVDTMLSIMLLYLMIGPSGACLSLDRLLARRRGANAPEPSVSANVAIRLLQVHLCIIYLIAGLAKLKGTTWWAGTAVWGTLAHFELAPMTNPLYLGILRLLGENPAVFYTFLFASTYFTLIFEITYPFIIWRPSLRWYALGSAFLLHGLIGVIMGLRTFAIIMFFMNMAFLTDREARWLAELPGRLFRKKLPITPDFSGHAAERSVSLQR